MTVMQILLLTLGGALVYEGFAWAVGPAAMRKAYHEAMAQLDDRQLGLFGLASLGTGLVLVLLAVRLAS